MNLGKLREMVSAAGGLRARVLHAHFASEVTLASEAAASVEQKAKAHKPEAAAGKQAVKPARRPARSLRAASKAKKLVCRYCGSDDLAPSFVKRRDARCRACFKQRYGSAGTAKKAKRPRRAKAE
jgi:hypothetical protein